MQNVPKIVRERLRAATPAVNHPDADALTAFTEHSLPELERDVVLEHLARCGECREIVALALPAMEPVERAIKPSPSGWLTWPALRWAFVAAGVVVIGSVGILRYQARFQHRTMSASNKASAPQSETTEAKNQPLATAPVAPTTAEKDKKIQSPASPALADSFDIDSAPVSDKKSNPHPAPPPPPALTQQFHGSTRGSVAGRRVGGPVLANQWQQNTAQNQAAVPSAAFGKQQAAAPSVNPQAPAVARTVEASGAAELTSQAQNTDTNLLQYQAAAQQPAADELRVRRDKPLPQPAPGQIGGHVVDPSGAVVSNARITVIPAKTGGVTNTVTDSQGAWLIAGLPTGNYRVQAEAPGFATAVKDLHYDANQPSMYSFTLSPGSVSEMVEVSAQNMQVQSDTASVADTITNREVSQVPVNGRNFTQLVALSPGGLQTFWSLNSAGVLRRSFDQGKTWQAVDVNAIPALNGASVAVAAETRAKTKALDKSRKGVADFTFRALAVADSDVWVGGSGGALYRSSDAGNHWTRVVPVASGSALTDDVVSLEFSDAQHGKFSTSAGEVWTTADAGQTWQKQ
ncbi:MAG: carboxypeptidase regulatory-like domain-containing protein [Candidatus Sulfotelmatobacter sp.]